MKRVSSDMNELVEHSSNILELMFENTHMLMAYLTPSFDFVKVNRAYAEAAGRSDPDFFVGKNHFDLYPHEENEAIFRQVVETREPVVIRAKAFEHPDQLERGTTYWDWSLTPTLSQSGEVVGLLFCVLDVTEHKRAELRRAAGEKSLRTVLDQVPQGVMVCYSSQVIFANRAIGEMLRIPSETIPGKTLPELLGADLAARLLRRLEFSTRNAAPQPLLATIVDDAGNVIPVEVGAHLIEFEGSGAVMLAFTNLENVRDTRDRAAVRERLETAGRVAGGVAHDFNNLLSVMEGSAALLRRSGLAQEQDDFLGQLELAIERASALTKQMLTFARGETLSPQAFCPARVITEYAPLLRRVLGDRIDLVIDVPAEVPHVLLDRSQFEQVLLNIAVNTSDACSTGCSLTISMAEDGAFHQAAGDSHAGSWVLISFRDTGPGMSPEVRRRVFEPFFSTKGGGKNSGLGLSTVYGVVRSAGGVVEIDSNPGKGTDVTVRLPATSRPKQDRRDSPRDITPFGDECIMLVEDDELLRHVMTQALELYGYEVLATRDHDGALTLAKKHPGTIDLIICDVILNGPNGYRVVSSVRERRPDVDVLMISGFLKPRPHDEAGEPLHHLAKPFSPSALAQKVRSILDEARQAGPNDAVRRSGRRALVLLVEDSKVQRRAMAGLLEAEGCEVVVADCVEAAVRVLHEIKFDAVVLDYTLGEGVTAVEVMQRVDVDASWIVVTGHDPKQIRARMPRPNVLVLEKPVSHRGLCEAIFERTGPSA